MKYNVGDKVRIKSIDWYDKNKDEEGSIRFNHNSFVSNMSEYCGKTATIIKKCEKYYFIDIDKRAWSWTDEMLDDIVESKKVKIILPNDCEIDYVNATAEDNCIVVEYISEKKEKFIPKDGDIVFAKVSGYEWIFIFKKQDEKSIHAYCSSDLPDETFFWKSDYDEFSDRSKIEYMRLATKEEQDKFFDVMKSKGFKWNKETKKVERLRWRAEEGENYYHLSTTIEVTHTTDDRYRVDNKHYASGNYFKTRSEAKEYAEKIQKLLIER